MIDEDKALKHAFNLIQQGNYQEASLLLSRLDSSTAEEWLQRVSEKISDARQGLINDGSDSPVGVIPGDNGLVISRVAPRNWGVWAGISGVLGIAVVLVIATFFAALMFIMFNANEYMLGLVPVLAAIFGAIFVRLYMTVLRVNTKFWVAFLALFFGLMTYGMYWQLHYFFYPINLDQQMTVEEFDQMLVEEVGQDGVLGFITFAPQLGQPVPRGQVLDFFDEFAPYMSPQESQIYWAIELAILLIIPVLLTRSVVKHRAPRVKQTSSMQRLLESTELDAVELIKSAQFDNIHQR